MIEDYLTKNLLNAVDDLRASIINATNSYNARIKYLSNKVDELESPLAADERISTLTKERDKARADLSRGFPITEEDQSRIDAWISQHIQEKHGGKGYCGCSGGRFTYCFTPTGIGTFGTIKCNCGAEYTFQEDV